MLYFATIRASRFKYWEKTGWAPVSYCLNEKAKAMQSDAKLRIRKTPDVFASIQWGAFWAEHGANGQRS